MLAWKPFAEIALGICRDLQSELVFFGGYTNGLVGYLPTASEIPRGGYEVEWMPVVYGPETGYLMHARPETADRIAEGVRQLYGRAYGER